MFDELRSGHHKLPHVKDMTGDMTDTHNSIFFAAVSTTRMPMVVTDPNQPDNPIVFANPAFMKMTGYSEEELVGHNCRLLQGPETDREVIAQVAKAISDRQEIAVEVLNYKKNKSSFWNALFVSPVFDPEGNLIYFFASQLDVTRRRDAEDALRQSQKMEAVGQLTGGIAHDFNNLLTVTQGFAEMLLANLDSGNFNETRARRSLDAILQATEKGAKLTAQLLAFSRKQKLEGRVVCLRDLTEKLIPLIERSVGDGVEVELIHTGQSCNSRIDVTQAELALINIAANARDAMEGKGRLVIKTGSCYITSTDKVYGGVDQGMYSTLSITDNGSGMDPEILAKISEPFFTTKTEGKGTGLGMSMVYGFINQSDGVMKVESEIGVGTTVRMLFKCVDTPIDTQEVKAQSAPAIRKGEKETILVVEDKADIAEYAQYVLTDFGYTVILAENASAALKIVQSGEKINLLFSDIIMPGSMNGVQLAREVTRISPDVKILMATGYTDSSVNITDAEGVDYDLIHKPYKRVELTNRIRAAIDGPDGIS